MSSKERAIKTKGSESSEVLPAVSSAGAYKLEVRLAGLPESLNRSRYQNRWAVSNKTKKWKVYVCASVLKLRPEAPLEKAKVTLVRHSSVAPDYDNLVASFKPVLDGLKLGLIIKDDSMKVIGVPDYDWQPAPPGKGFITVKVEGVA